MRRHYRKKNNPERYKKKRSHLLDYEIKAKQVMLIDKDKKVNEVVDTDKAIAMAKELNLNLVCFSLKNQTPVCKILDYEKYKYDLLKSEKKKRKNQVKIVRKEYRIGILTSDHDINYRKKQIVDSLQKGFHVKISLKLHGRFLGIDDAGFDTLNKLADDLKDYSEVDKPPARTSKRYVDLYLVPNKAVLKKLKENQKMKKNENNKKNSAKENTHQVKSKERNDANNIPGKIKIETVIKNNKDVIVSKAN